VDIPIQVGAIALTLAWWYFLKPSVVFVVDILDNVGHCLQVVKRALMNIIDSRKKCWKASWRWTLLQSEGTCPPPLK
jgi:hypothetical protein